MVNKTLRHYYTRKLSDEDAEDVMQTAALKLHAAKLRGNTIDNEKAYFSTIIQNVVRVTVTKNARFPRIFSTDPTNDPVDNIADPTCLHTQFEYRELQAKVKESSYLLPIRQKQMLHHILTDQALPKDFSKEADGAHRLALIRNLKKIIMEGRVKKARAVYTEESLMATISQFSTKVELRKNHKKLLEAVLRNKRLYPKAYALYCTLKTQGKVKNA